MSCIEVRAKNLSHKKEIEIENSKSISNRALIISALVSQNLDDIDYLTNLSSAEDTKLLKSILLQKHDNTCDKINSGAGGTTFRFLTSFLALRTQNKVLLSGNQRMNNRPIGPLIDALNSLGARIEYADKAGFPPVYIKPVQYLKGKTISMPAGISSQFISSILLIAPYIKNGLSIELTGEIVSQPYIELTLEIMKKFGATYEKHDRRITVAEKEYDLEYFQIEGDWSAASYFVSLCIATEGKLKLRLHPLDSESSQADKQILEIAKMFGLKYKFEKNSLIISYEQPQDFSNPIKVDFINCPDIAQTVMVIAAISGTPLLMKGLKTLFIKETNRVNAMTKELSKVGISIRRTHKIKNPRKDHYLLEGKIETSNDPVRFNTYNDHRMAMSLSAIATVRPIQLDDSDVVNKSYPDYWNVLSSLGFQVFNLK